MEGRIDKKLVLIAIIVGFVLVSRLLPHEYNFTPLGALALFMGFNFKQHRYGLLGLLAMVWLSDLLVNNLVYPSVDKGFTLFYDGFYWQYIAYALVYLFTSKIITKNSIVPVVLGSVVSSLLFFLISNFGSMIIDPMYTKDLSGLIQSYANGLPFFRATILGDLAWCAVMFGSLAVVESKSLILKRA